jgi:hypothetical protein
MQGWLAYFGKMKFKARQQYLQYFIDEQGSDLTTAELQKYLIGIQLELNLSSVKFLTIFKPY